MAKVLIMLVRVLGLVAFVLGVLLWTGRQQYLGPHIGGGIFVAFVLFVLALVGLTMKAVVPGILGIVLAVLVPVIGLKQLPLTFHTMGAIQVAHIVFALAAIGVAESLYGTIRRAS